MDRSEIRYQKKASLLLLTLAGLSLLFGFSTNDSLRDTFSSNLGIKGEHQISYNTAHLVSITDNIVSDNYLLSRITTCKALPPGTDQIPLNIKDWLILVNKRFSYDDIPEPVDLVSLIEFGIPAISYPRLRLPAARDLQVMFTDMQLAGINAAVSSGYRTRQDQENMYRLWTGIVGKQLAGDYAALPGSSEHQLGMAVDIITYENNLKLMPTYENTRLNSWLIEHAFEYGFTRSYPKGKENITGFAYEPWHYRYVGKDAAKYLTETGLTLTEYLYRLNNYCLMD